MNVPVNVSPQFMFGCLSFPLEQQKKKQVCFLSFIHNVQVSINNNIKKQEKMTNAPGYICNKNADQTVLPHNLMPVFFQPGMFYSFRHAKFFITKHLINCL